MTGRLLTARVVAQQLGVTTETILAWVREGKLPAYRLPSGAVRIREDSLNAWLEERATPRLAAPYDSPINPPERKAAMHVETDPTQQPQPEQPDQEPRPDPQPEPTDPPRRPDQDDDQKDDDD